MTRLLPTTLLLLFLTFGFVVPSSFADEDQDDRQAEIEELKELLQERLGLEGEQAEILQDVFGQIQRQIRDEEHDGDEPHASDDDRDADEVSINIELDKDVLDDFSRQLETHMEDLGTSIEDWAEGFEQQMEAWAEQYGEDMEVWAEEFGNSWEEWAETQGTAWEDWGQQFAERWETWAESIEEGQINEEDIKRLIESNKDMIQDMPVQELYEQFSRSKKHLENLPWESLEGIEEIVKDSLEQGIRGMEQVEEAGQVSPEVQDAARAYQEALAQMRANLNRKRAGLEEARLKAMKEWKEASKHDRKQAMELLMEAIQAQDPHGKNNQRHVHEEVMSRVMEELQKQAAQSPEHHQHAIEMARRQIEEQRRRIEEQQEHLRDQKARMEDEHQRALQDQMRALEEVAQRQEAEARESHMNELRQEIATLREHIIELRELSREKED